MKSVVLKTQGADSLKDNIITVLGVNTFSCLEHLTIHISDSCKVEGFLSKPGQGSGRNLGDRQYFFVNGRPVDMPKVNKLVNELYRCANSRQYPIAIMNFTVPTISCDVNVTPDKRKIFFSDENSILHALREGLQKIYSSTSARFSVNKAEQLGKETDEVDLCSPSEISSNLFKQTCEAGIIPENIDSDEGGLGAETPFKIKEMDAQSFRDLNGSVNDTKEGSFRKDFSLKVDNFKKSATSLKSNSEEPLNSVMSKPSLLSSRMVEKGAIEDRYSYKHSPSVQSSLEKFLTVHKRKHESISTALTEVPVLRNESSASHKKSNTLVHAEVSGLLGNKHCVDTMDEDNDTETSKTVGEHEFLDKVENFASTQGGKINDGQAEEVC